MSLRIPYNENVGVYFNVTLKESDSGITSGNSFFFVFTNEQTDKEYTVILVDQSSYPDRYNRFYITTLKAGGIGSQNVAFKTEGWYEYKVYTYADRITRNNLLELGKCYVYDNDTPSSTSYSYEKNKYVYNK